MDPLSKIVTLENPVLLGYLTYSSVLVLKMMLMSVLTGMQRRKHNVSISPEDKPFVKDHKVLPSHADVDRVRRAHLNDLENIPIFFVAGFAYLLTNPGVTTALALFRIFTVSRCVHTFVYAMVVIPRVRGVAWAAGFLTTAYMAFSAICHFATF